MCRYKAVYLVFALFVFGCASAVTQRTVSDGVLRSSFPEIVLKVDPGLRYVGELEHTSEGQSIDGSRSVGSTHKSFLFLHDSQNHIERLIDIRVTQVETHFVSDLFEKTSNKLESGSINCYGQSYQYCLRPMATGMNGKLTRYFTEKGYIVPNCLMSLQYSKVFGGGSNFMFSIIYMEDASMIQMDCRKRTPESLAEQEVQSLQQFKERSIAAFNIISQNYSPRF